MLGMSMNNSFKPKEFNTFEDQITKLKSRNMGLDERDTLNQLKKCNYYRLSGYWYFFKKETRKDDFREGTTFQDVLSLYEFDSKLRKVIFEILEHAEVKLRTAIAYTHTMNHTSTGYLLPTTFQPDYKHTKWKESIIPERKKKTENEDFVKHNNSKYGDNWPLWVLVEILSFENIWVLYKFLKADDKKYIKDHFFNLDESTTSFLTGRLIDLRNEYAHHMRLVYKPRKEIKLSKPYVQNNNKNDYFFNNVGLFMYIYAIKLFLGYDERFISFVDVLDKLIQEYSINLELLGFPNRWKAILNCSLI